MNRMSRLVTVFSYILRQVLGYSCYCNQEVGSLVSILSGTRPVKPSLVITSLQVLMRQATSEPVTLGRSGRGCRAKSWAAVVGTLNSTKSGVALVEDGVDGLEECVAKDVKGHVWSIVRFGDLIRQVKSIFDLPPRLWIPPKTMPLPASAKAKSSFCTV